MHENRLMKIALALSAAAVLTVFFGGRIDAKWFGGQKQGPSPATGEQQIDANAERMLAEGKQTFRFDTFGDEVFWTDALQLHRAIEGEKFGGVGPGVSPKTALAVGLKVDSAALPASLITQLRQGRVNLDDPATTLALLKLDAVVGISQGSLCGRAGALRGVHRRASGEWSGSLHAGFVGVEIG